MSERHIPAKEQVMSVKWEFKTQGAVVGGEVADIGPHHRGMQWYPPLPCLQLKPGTPLPSPEDLRGKILIKNKKNQFSGPASPSKKPGGMAEGSLPSSVPVEEDTGEWVRAVGWNLGRARAHKTVCGRVDC